MSPERRALIVVDVQKGFDDPAWGNRNNPDCEDNIASLISHWKRIGEPLVYVRHDSTTEGSPLRPGLAGNDLREFVDGQPDLLVTKSVNSAFYGEPDLDGWLRAGGIGAVAICGVQTNYCCETTARMAGNLGYETLFVLDATHTFDQIDLDGVVIPADQLARVTAANLQDEFAQVVSTEDLIG